ncbi:CD4-1 molecule [Latimeria chalumnae]|nr:PREDICTED: lymphocyte activation gene 3 protein isoform X2 [Latimeria chalumnae]XP_006004760.1 PREDICTED: lymphocyte activation gene 3 protein isoform X2 [Latimeria chalumnae]XP_006004761.1 PREDICTED: lymphocyte activation gene 3 protein isoform X2 [Latimeria chalumnae]XP_006004762.1 PREDICTED: lymphocyte activation gene 3 protein isoform X2 [Latimeria chalumnae]|eukprot:XP_006004759.1 PREDICTED: lymphocyte activation gene 3 protein isoform X2 [Latimeria chalumnae]
MEVFATSESGGILPCHWLSSKAWQHKYTKTYVRWEKNQNGVSSTVLWTKNNGIIMMGNALSRRALINEPHFKDGDFSMRIKPMLPEDAGVYTCTVQLGVFQKQCRVKLHVMQVTSSQDSPVLENDSVRLTCDLTDEIDLGTVAWYHKGSRIYSTTPRCTLQRDGRELTVRNLTVHDSGTWKCELKHKNKTAMATHDLHILGFSNSTVQTHSIYAGVGSVAMLPCTLNMKPEGIQGRFYTGWSHKGESDTVAEEILLTNSRAVLEQAGKGERSHLVFQADGSENLTLTISPMREADRGIYTCFVEIGGKRIEKSIRLAVLTIVSSGMGMMREGATIQLTCGSSELSGGERFEWHQLDPTNTSQSRKTYWGQTLVLPAVSGTEAGKWVCTVYQDGIEVGHVEYDLKVAESLYGTRANDSPWKTTFGVIAALLILLLLALLAAFLRQRKRREQRFPALESSRNAAISAMKKVFGEKSVEERKDEECL